MNFYRPFFQPCLMPMLSQSLAVGVLAAVSLLSGLAPELSGRPGALVFSSTAYAQTAISSEEVTNYARSVLLIESVRQTAYNEVKNMGGDVSSIACNKPESMSALPNNARNVVVNYCNRSKSIIESNGLSAQRFNAITMSLQSDSNLNKRIHNELIRLQNSNP